MEAVDSRDSDAGSARDAGGDGVNSLTQALAGCTIDPTDPYYATIIAARSLLDKREIHLRVMMFNLRLSITDEPKGMYYEAEYCFHDEALAWFAFATWDGESDPIGFAKNATTGERGPGFIERR